MMKRNAIGVIVIFCLFACSARVDVQASREEEAYFKEVVKRRIQGRSLIDYGLYFSKDDSYQKVYSAMAKYYDRTDCFFVTLLEDYPALAGVGDDMTLNDVDISDVELVDILASHVYATLQLYRGGVMKNIHDEYKNNLLELMPALVAQHEDLKVLQHLSEANTYVDVK